MRSPLTSSVRLSSLESAERHRLLHCRPQLRRASLHRGQHALVALFPFQDWFYVPCTFLMLRSIPVARLIHRTRRSVACRHVRRCRSSVHVGSPSLAISGNNSSTHGCAQVLVCSSTSPSPPASIIRPEIELLRHPLFFKIAIRDFVFEFGNREGLFCEPQTHVNSAFWTCLL